MSFKFIDIRDKNSEQLTALLANEIESSGGQVSISFLADQIKRKENKEFSFQMATYTKWIAVMTFIMLSTTILNIAIVFCGGVL